MIENENRKKKVYLCDCLFVCVCERGRERERESIYKVGMYKGLCSSKVNTCIFMSSVGEQQQQINSNQHIGAL